MDQTRTTLVHRAKLLENLTIGFNVIEGTASVAAGVFVNSIVLVGFGVDSFIEVASGVAVLWRMTHDAEPIAREQADRISLRFIGGCFLVLAIYITYDAVSTLAHKKAPEESLMGIIIACLSLIVMPLLAWSKRKVAAQLNSGAMTADAKQTMLCSYLAAILLAGLVLNKLFGWWWADPVSALIMVPIIAREGVEALKGKKCCEN